LPERAAGQAPCGGRAIVDIVIRAVINALAFIAAVYVIPTADFRGDWWKMVAVAAIFGIVNAYLRPIAKLLSLPLNLLTFGLVGLVINIAMVLLTALVSDALRLGFTLAGWPQGRFDLDVIIAALLVAIVVSIVSTVLAFVRLVTPRI
jgi:putative membrane protein